MRSLCLRQLVDDKSVASCQDLLRVNCQNSLPSACCKLFQRVIISIYTRKNLATCSNSANKPLTSCVRTACYKCQQVWNNLLTTCTKLVDIIRLVTRLFQQGYYNHDTTILLQPCVVNLVTFLLYYDCIILVRTTCNRSDNAIKLVTTNQKQAVRTQLVDNL